MEVKIIYLDCDGVLYPPCQLSMQEMIDALLSEVYNVVSKEEAQRISEQCKKEGHKGLLNYLLAVREFDIKKFEQSCKRVAQTINYQNIVENKELLDVIKQLKKKYLVYLFTNNVKAHVEEVFKRLFDCNIKDTEIDCIDIVSTLDNGVFHPKHGGGLELICKKLNCRPEKCLLVDDTKNNINAAKEIGMQTMHIKSDDDIVEKLKALI